MRLRVRAPHGFARPPARASHGHAGHALAHPHARTPAQLENVKSMGAAQDIITFQNDYTFRLPAATRRIQAGKPATVAQTDDVSVQNSNLFEAVTLLITLLNVVSPQNGDVETQEMEGCMRGTIEAIRRMPAIVPPDLPEKLRLEAHLPAVTSRAATTLWQSRERTEIARDAQVMYDKVRAGAWREDRTQLAGHVHSQTPAALLHVHACLPPTHARARLSTALPLQLGSLLKDRLPGVTLSDLQRGGGSGAPR